ncbi:MAG: hypothetical protein IT365_23455 [Candidatus Hydrogenedentes bacterium]|nr:hypothetical protein [Candidatus Hydrogenedentota bacterium]
MRRIVRSVVSGFPHHVAVRRSRRADFFEPAYEYTRTSDSQECIREVRRFPNLLLTLLVHYLVEAVDG